MIGQHCALARYGGVGDHVKITDHVVITAQSGVSRDIAEPGVYSSTLTVAGCVGDVWWGDYGIWMSYLNV